MADDTGHAYAELGRKPVSADAPCGANARYEADFEALEAEIAKQESLNAAKVDWRKVSTLAAGILDKQSKDLLVAVYLARALLETEGYAGFNVGLGIIHDLITTHWDGLFPPLKRARARGTALEWLAERGGAALTARTPSPSELEAVIAAAEQAKAIDQELGERLGADAPALRELTNPLREHARAAEQRQQKTQAAATPSAAASEPAASSAAGPATSSPAADAVVGDIGSENEARRAIRQIQDTGRKLCGFWLGARLADARAYRVARQNTWGFVDKLPPDTDGATQLAPPAPERRKHFETQYENGQFAALLPELEQSLTRAPFWLSGQRLAADSLAALGADYQDAQAAVCQEVTQVMTRFPRLAELRFADGTPFADDKTRLWLAGLKSDAASGEAAAPATEAAPWQAAIQEARAAGAKGKAAAAIAQLQAGAARAASGRERCEWQLALGDFLVQAGHAGVAVPVLEALEEDIARYATAYWEPELAARTYRLLLSALERVRQKRKTDTDLASKAASAHARLSRLDAATAITIKGD